MTISSETRTAGPFVGNGVSTGPYTFSFKVFADSDVLVVQTDTDGVETTRTLTTHYTVSRNANQDVSPGGTITLTSALADDYLLTLTSQIGNTQAVQLINQGGWLPNVINGALDKLTILVQQLLNKINRSFKIPLSDGTSMTTELPTKTLRANKLFAFDDDGNPTMLTDPSDSAIAAAASAVAAAASAAEAEAAASVTVNRFDGTGAQTAFTLTVTPASEDNTWVYVSGVYQQKDTYSVSGTTLTFSSAPPSGTSNIEVVIGVMNGSGNGSFTNMTVTGDFTFFSSSTGTFSVFTAGGAVDITTSTGDITVSSNSGAVTVSSNSGNVELSATSGNVLVESSSGNVTVQTTSGDMALTTNQTMTVTAGLGLAIVGDVAIDGGTTTEARTRGLNIKTSAGNVSMSSQDDVMIVNKTVGAATQVTLPSSPTTGRAVTVKDGKGDANSNNITVVAASGNIDGSASHVISTAYGSQDYVYNGTQWNKV